MSTHSSCSSSGISRQTCYSSASSRYYLIKYCVSCLFLAVGFVIVAINQKPLSLLPLEASKNSTTAVETTTNTTRTNATVQHHHHQQEKATTFVTTSSFSNIDGLPKLAPDTRMCRLPSSLVYGQEPLSLENETGVFENIGLTFRYQCAGQRYKNFTSNRIWPLIRRKQQQLDSDDETLQGGWSRRPFLVPPTTATTTAKNSKTTIRILVMGNSHTRQVMATLLCQYQPYAVNDGIRLFHPHSNRASLVSREVTLEFPSSTATTVVKIAMLFNHPAVYSKTHWKENLEEFLEVPSLSSIDMIIVGMFNNYQGPKFDNTGLWTSVWNNAKDYPHYETNPTDFPYGIPLQDLAQVFAGPIVYLSQLKIGGVEHFQAAQQFIRGQNRTNLYAVNARGHLTEPELNHTECSSEKVDTVGDCNLPSHIRYRDGHRCTGSYGGETDLAAYELVETLWTIFS